MTFMRTIACQCFKYGIGLYRVSIVQLVVESHGK
jgi:hypothetical protein